ncbi:MAG: hypothetical protein M3Z05_05530 [Gemmatimonadota bacterium]|nr:hypothetical protein [Gemmatimonadota bacterium]
MIPLERFLTALHGGGVEFVIIGGVAAQAHGSARVTQDLDVCYNRTDDNLRRLVRALSPYGPYLRGAPPGLPFSFSVATIRAGLNFTLTTEIGDIDLLGEVTGGGGYDQMAAHSVEVDAFGFTTRVISLPWLIHVKRAAGRPKDLEVIAELEALEEEIERG